ncbi:hypothetical protein BD414DRAFT_472396 [Trametes punicea]|nr:hypothetical protein BD414DRAFT_472396 [Trametes punicea]
MAATVESNSQPAQSQTASITVTTVSAPAAPNGRPAPLPGEERGPWLTFPPFPKPPPGVELIPFSAFKPAGIPLAVEPTEPGYIELDGLGIPTVTLRVHHDLTAMERRKRKRTKVGHDGLVTRTTWYEEWADGEELRRTATAIDPSIPRIDSLHQAAYDFKHGRPLHINQELAQLWDRWRLYIGLISGMQPPASRKKNAAIRDALAAMAEAPADDDDDDDEDEMPETRPPQEASVLVTNDEGADVSAIHAPLTQPKPGFTEEERQQRREYYREVRDTKIDRFLNDPETAVKIFFSGYYRDRGMIFSRKFCRDGPILLSFFLNFLLRNRVFPESEKDIRKAVAVTEQAKQELPHSFVISGVIPDDFSRGCELLFGTMTYSTVWQNAAPSSGDDDENRPNAKRQKMNGPMAPTVLQDAAGPNPIEVVTPDTMMAMEEDAKELFADANMNREQDVPAPTWGADPSETPESAPGPSWGDANAVWGAPENPNLWDTTPKANPLNEFFGPTVLPLTHTTGVVERSTRRVKAIIPPPATTPAAGQRKGKKGAVQPRTWPDPAAVERDLEARLVQVVLIPWHEWDVYDKADVTKPLILPESRGAAIREEDEVLPPSEEGASKPHNPFKDEITLLVEPSTAEKLLVGVGIEATWVQLARVDPSVPVQLETDAITKPHNEPKKHVGGPGEPAVPTKYWYMEQVLSVLPSFHTEMVPLPTTEDVFGNEA